MTLFIIISSLVLLIVLISAVKINPFLAFLVVSIYTGFMVGVPIEKISQSMQKGIGDMLGSLIVIIILGAMLGKLVAESGAAQKIASLMLRVFGEKYIQWGLMSTGFIIGIPLFYNVGFVLVIPLIFSVVYRYKLPAVYIGLPMLASLSVAHGFLPPHPSPAALVVQFNANMGMTLFYGIIIAIPAIIIAGPIFSKTLKNVHSEPTEAFVSENMPDSILPSGWNSFITALLPVILLAITTILPILFPQNEGIIRMSRFIGDPAIVMLIALLVATFSLGLNMGRKIPSIMDIYGIAVKDVAMVLLIIGGAGGLKQVLLDGGLTAELSNILKDVNMPPLILAWLIAAVIRVCLGSATVAGLTTAGILAPMIPSLNVNPGLMVLSVGAGSLFFSHVNDPGFWLFKEYFNLNIKDTIRSWSVMETIVSVVGLIGVLILNVFI